MTDRIGGILTLCALCAGAAETHVYARLEGEELRLDYYRAQGAAPRPAAILVHGGGWTGGSREMAAMTELAALFNEVGIDAFSVDYRLAPKHVFPAAIDDVGLAIAWIRKRAMGMGLDAKRIVLVGGSAGAYLVNMAAVRGAKVSAVISLYGSSDFRNQPMTENRRAFLGELSVEKTSPAMLVTGNEPPFLLLHGDRDERVPMAQSVQMQLALQRAGVPAELIVIPGGAHGLTEWGDARPWKREMLDWLRRAWRMK